MTWNAEQHVHRVSESATRSCASGLPIAITYVQHAQLFARMDYRARPNEHQLRGSIIRQAGEGIQTYTAEHFLRLESRVDHLFDCQRPCRRINKWPLVWMSTHEPKLWRGISLRSMNVSATAKE